ncbi:MAG: cell wall hydrolase [Clostridia bacterium]|nr:cell wall hydrolase [Clostridia bacterium]
MEQILASLRRYRWFLLFGLAVVIGLLTYTGLGRRVEQSPAPEIPVQAYRPARGVSRSDEVDLLARLVAAEAGNEPYAGQVAVAAVVLNRVAHPSFPNTLAGVIYQPLAFESVTTGWIWRAPGLVTARRAAIDALNGWDPTYGSLYFWNPAKPVNPWIWTRQIVTQIGRHIFAR